MNLSIFITQQFKTKFFFVCQARKNHLQNTLFLRWFRMNCDMIRKQAIRDKLNFGRTLMVNVNLEFPAMVGHDMAAVRFNHYNRQKAQKSYNYARIKLFPQAVKQYQFSKSQDYPFNAYELMQVYEVTYCTKPIVSLFFDLYEYTGGAHGNTIRTGNTWDLKKGNLLILNDLFMKDYDYNKVILKTIEAEARRRQISGKADYFEDLPQNLVKFYDEKNFYLTEGGIAIFYPLYTIAPYAVGIQVFIIPYLLFGNNLKIKL